MNKFKVGDKVIALIDDNIGEPKAYLKGDIFTISDSFKSDFDKNYYCTLTELTLRWPNHCFFENDFEIVNNVAKLEKITAITGNPITSNGSIHPYHDCKNNMRIVVKQFKQLYNLSQEEIDQIMAEIKEAQNQLNLPGIQQAAGTQSTPYYFGYDPSKNGYKEANGNVASIKSCIHEWTTYIGLNHTDTYCKLCNMVKK